MQPADGVLHTRDFSDSLLARHDANTAVAGLACTEAQHPEGGRLEETGDGGGDTLDLGCEQPLAAEEIPPTIQCCCEN